MGKARLRRRLAGSAGARLSASGMTVGSRSAGCAAAAAAAAPTGAGVTRRLRSGAGVAAGPASRGSGAGVAARRASRGSGAAGAGFDPASCVSRAGHGAGVTSSHSRSASSGPGTGVAGGVGSRGAICASRVSSFSGGRSGGGGE